MPVEEVHARASALPRAVDLGPARGVEIELGPGAWALVRASATEPIARLTVEAPDGNAAEALLAELLAELGPQ